MTKEEKICGTCKYHCHEEIDDGWICANDQSDYLADWCDYDHTCEEWEGKE